MNRMPTLLSLAALALGISPSSGFLARSLAAEEDQPDEVFAGLKARLVGPALMSGRIGDFAVHPDDSRQFYAAACSGGVWKTVNGGATWTPVFDSQGSYSIGCLALDPGNPHVLWVGAGENNSQRSVGFGDGVYRSRDGGQHWDHLGLEDSEHIGMIRVHPANSDLVYVAAQGPLWRSGGERGLYRTPDGGVTWQRILHISDDTGVNEVHLDPRDPDVLYASAYQRRRHVWTLINGGPESAIYKSTDAGKTWRKLTRGLPKADKGRIGLAISPVNPDVLYAIVEAANDEGGFFRSTDRGETWEKRSDYMTSSPQYYNEIFADPVAFDRVYAVDTFLRVTDDGGRTFQRVPIKNKHVDDHALWIDPRNNRHLLVGCDGGIYETHDRGEHWAYFANLPITQFYRVSADNSRPFYRVFGGTQDNSSQGGPSRTTDRAGITSADWFLTVGGDGYETLADPTDPNTLYSLWQYGGLVRYDHPSGEIMDIKPREAPGEAPLKWNWDSPLILSPHHPERLYFAANRLFRTDDRGDSWKAVSGDLTRGLDRNQLPVMGRIQSPDAVAKHNSTSMYGNAVALTESPVREGVLYVGTDDGLVHVTDDGGENWRRIEFFPGVPDLTYVSCLTASQHDADTVYAAFDNHKNGDFKPYLLVSTNQGGTWVSMAGDLPERETVYSVQQDHEKPDLLFAGTEFGAWFTLDGGKHWKKVAGLPTIAVRDLEIQRRENDLVLGTFGRSIYILDDYSPLRLADEALLKEPAAVFPIKDALRYLERSRLGGRDGRGSQGASFYAAANPPFGAVFTYHLKEKLRTRRELRQEAEKKAGAGLKKEDYPALADLRAEDRDQAPEVWLVVRDDQGEILRQIPGSRDRGLHRVAWDLRLPSSEPVQLKGGEEPAPWEDLPSGPLALPGNYTVTLTQVTNGGTTELAPPVEFRVIPLELATFAAADKEATFEFQRKVAGLQRAVEGALKSAAETQSRLDHLRASLRVTPGVEPALAGDIEELTRRLDGLLVALRGDPSLAKRFEPELPSIVERVQNIVGSQWNVTSAPTRTERDAYQYAGEAFAEVLEKYRRLVEDDLRALEARLEAAGAPWTPGRVPHWHP
ncbi:MAG: glycosyl hydrolase [Verrucomicrobiales bacterium]|nr:glycosyl hydrolase [Verrucomicrobiales bacterium]MCP5526132.1 glycosyl hydrolase [Verrucomicrobiales bacterium]